MSEEFEKKDVSAASEEEQQYSLNDDRRVKVLSPGAMVAKRFIRNRIAVVGLVILAQAGCLSSFMSPMATPTVPMSMALGGYDLKSVFKQSLIPAVICCVVSVLWIMTVFPI